MIDLQKFADLPRTPDLGYTASEYRGKIEIRSKRGKLLFTKDTWEEAHDTIDKLNRMFAQ